MIKQPPAPEELAGGIATAPFKASTRPSAWVLVARSLIRNRAALLGAVVLLVVVLAAVAGPYITPHDPIQQNLKQKLRPPAWIEGGDSRYLLGTDHLGRDLLSRVIVGARISLTIGLLSVFVSGTIGTALGILAGFGRGWIDDLISRLIDVQLAVPYLLLAVALMMLIGSSLRNIIFVLVLYGWTVYARLVRAEVLSLREREFILAARAAGVPPPRIMWRHVLPNVLSPVIVMSTLEMANMIIFAAGLSFLGLGIQPPSVSWGGMLSDGRDYIPAGIWWPATFPGLAISLTVLAINEVGDWLRDLLDPRMKT